MNIAVLAALAAPLVFWASVATAYALRFAAALRILMDTLDEGTGFVDLPSGRYLILRTEVRPGESEEPAGFVPRGLSELRGGAPTAPSDAPPPN